jgi:hypothetical protein
VSPGHGGSLVSSTAMRIFGVKMPRFSGGVKDHSSPQLRAPRAETGETRATPRIAPLCRSLVSVLGSLPKRFLKPVSGELQACLTGSGARATLGFD